MATTVQPPANRIARDPKNASGNGGWRNLVPANGDLHAVREFAPPPASTGIWVFVAAVCMTFAALTSALVVRKGGSLDWRHLTLPYILYVNTAVLVASSVTLEIARRKVAAFMGGVKTGANPSRWLYATLALGFVFLAGQYLAWRQLSAQGLYLATNPSSSFFYVFTALHAVHLLGGLYAMTRVIRKLNQHVLRRVTLDATAHYWHFMDVLWIYLLALLWMKL
ncbi:MAG: cytochrome c oxidase subunit 3 [Terriglobales bacterium]